MHAVNFINLPLFHINRKKYILVKPFYSDLNDESFNFKSYSISRESHFNFTWELRTISPTQVLASRRTSLPLHSNNLKKYTYRSFLTYLVSIYNIAVASSLRKAHKS